MAIPLDLQISSSPDPSDKDYFDVVISPLKTGQTYDFGFQWIFVDNVLSQKVGINNWSNYYPYASLGQIKPSGVSGLSGTWFKDDGVTKTDTLRVSFTSDPTLNNSSNNNTNIVYYKIKLTSGGVSYTFYHPINKATSSQVFYLSATQNKSHFGLFKSSFDISVIPVDLYGGEGTESTATSGTYVTALDVPVITAASATLSYLVTISNWSTQDANILDKVYIEEVESNSATDPGTGYTLVAQSGSNPVTVSSLNTNKRWIRAKFYDKNGNSTGYSVATTATPTSPVVVDDVGPGNVTSVTATGGIDTSGYMGFNGYITVSWPAVVDTTLRGYRIRFSNDAGATYSYVDSPGTGTTYKLGGLAVGATYQIAVATYDQYNNTSSSYISASSVTITGTPAVTNYISAGNFKFGYGINTASDKGLYFDANNYWYINASNSARFKLGGSTTNYVQWDGTTFAIDGNITARAGQFSGNVLMLGGSIYSGSTVATTVSGVVGNGTTATYTTAAAHGLSSNAVVYITGLSNSGFNGRYTITVTGTTTFTAANATNATISTQSGSIYNISTGYVLNSSGIAFNNQTFIDASTGKLTTLSANIGGWDVTSSTITKNGITLNSTGTIVANNGAYYVGIKPQVSAGTDIVLWAGQSSNGSTANFRVDATGKLTAAGAVLTGYATSTDLAGYLPSTALTDNVTVINGSQITTGTINLARLAIYSATPTATGPYFQIDSSAIKAYSWDGATQTQTLNVSSAGAVNVNGAITATSFQLRSTAGDYWSVTSGSQSTGFRFGGVNGINFAGSTIDLGSSVKITGNLTSTGSIVGGIIRTAVPGVNQASVELNSAYPERISFYPSSSTTGWTAGYIFNGVITSTEEIINADTTSSSTSIESAYAQISPPSKTGYGNPVFNISGGADGKRYVRFYADKIRVYNETAVGPQTPSSFRNIYINSNLVGNSSSTGLVGDIWIQY